MAGEEALGQDYVLHEEIGRGATGVVRRATHRGDGVPVAAKLLRPDLAGDLRIRDLLLHEEAVLRGLRHDTVVAVRELIFERGQLALLMEFVDGPDLRQYLVDHGGTLPPTEAVAVATQVASGLAAAHAQGIVHLDLKPENVLIQRDTRPPTVKIADFGVAALLFDAGRDPASLGTTPGYTAPEIVNGSIAAAPADIFSLGVILVEMLTGVRPGRGRTRPHVRRAGTAAPTRTRQPR